MNSCLRLIYDFTTYYDVWQRERMEKRKRDNRNGTKRVGDAHVYTKIILINLANSNGDEETDNKKATTATATKKKKHPAAEIN